MILGAAEPQSQIISDDKAVLASSEGWLELRAKWRVFDQSPDDPKFDPPLTRSHFLQVNYDLCFHPRSAPSEKQNYRKRLHWVHWSGK